MTKLYTLLLKAGAYVCKHIDTVIVYDCCTYVCVFNKPFWFEFEFECPIPMDTTVRLGPLQFSLQATVDHHGPSIDSGHYTASINCCKKKHSIATITKLRSLELLIKTPLLHILYYINGLTHDFWTRTGRVGVWSLPWRWHILSIPLTTGRGTSAETCGLDDVFPPDDLGSRPEASVLIYMYIYMYVHSLYVLCYRSYIQRECHSVLTKLHPITFYRGVRGSWAECHFLFSLVYHCVLLLDKNLILGCLWMLVFLLNKILILGIWCSTISHLPGCFCPWTFFENIGLNTVLTYPLCHI